MEDRDWLAHLPRRRLPCLAHGCASRAPQSSGSVKVSPDPWDAGPSPGALWVHEEIHLVQQRGGGVDADGQHEPAGFAVDLSGGGALPVPGPQRA